MELQKSFVPSNLDQQSDASVFDEEAVPEGIIRVNRRNVVVLLFRWSSMRKKCGRMASNKMMKAEQESIRLVRTLKIQSRYRPHSRRERLCSLHLET
jgi:hypothetical protein